MANADTSSASNMLDIGQTSPGVDGVEDAVLRGDVYVPELHVFFLPSICARVIKARANTVATTWIHKVAGFGVLTKGRAVAWNADEIETLKAEDGVYMEAPFAFVTAAGTRRVVIVLDDCEWWTYHPIPPGLQEADVHDYLFAPPVREDGASSVQLFAEALRRTS